MTKEEKKSNNLKERRKPRIEPVSKPVFENETSYISPSVSPRNGKKIKIRFEFELLRIERIPKKLENDGVTVYWKKKASYLTTKKEHGQTVPLLLTSPVTNFSRQNESTFSFSTHLHKEKNSDYLTPRKFVSFGVQVERVKHSHKKQKLGTADILLNDYSKDGQSTVVSLELNESSLSSSSSHHPPPILFLSIKTTWLKSDGELLVSDDVANVEVNYDTENDELHNNKSSSSSSLKKSKSSSSKRRKRATKQTDFKGETSTYDTISDSDNTEISESNDHSDGEFTVDEFESDMEQPADNDENAYLTRKNRLKIGVSQTFDKLSKKSESSAKLIKRSVVHSIHKSTQSHLNLRFNIEILSVKPLSSNTNNKKIYVTWRRGSKKKNSGKSSHVMCINGVADWTRKDDDENDDDTNNNDEKNEDEENEELKNAFKIQCTLYQQKNKSSQSFSSISPYEEKTIAFQVKRVTPSTSSSSSSSSAVIGHVIVNLAEFYEEGTKVKSFPLIVRGAGMNTGSAKITSRELGSIKGSNEPLLLVPQIELKVTSELRSDDDANEDEDSNQSDDNVNNSDVSVSSSPSTSNPSLIQDKSKEVFGKPILAALLENGERKYEVAPFITSISNAIITNSVTRQGLFRLAGRGSKIQEIIDIINSGAEFEASEYGAHEIGDVLKRYIRSLPEPIFPLSFYESFLEIGEKLDHLHDHENEEVLNEFKEKVSQLIQQFPVQNSALLRQLCYLLENVALHADQNLMNYDNLATVFGPTLLSKNEDDPLRILYDNPKKIAVFKFILLNWKYVWHKQFDWSEVDRKLEEKYPPEVRMNKLVAQINQLKNDNENITQKYQILERSYTQSLHQIETLQSDLSTFTLIEKAIYIQSIHFMEINQTQNNIITHNNNNNNDNYNNTQQIKNPFSVQTDITFQLLPLFNEFKPSVQIPIIRAIIHSINKTLIDQKWNAFWLATTLQIYKYFIDKSSSSSSPSSDENILIDLNHHSSKYAFDELTFLTTIEKYDDFLEIFNLINRYLFSNILRNFQAKLEKLIILIFKETPIAHPPNVRHHENSSVIDPILECIYDKLIVLLYDNFIYHSVIKQFAIKVFTFIAQSAISTLILNPTLCTSKIGLRIKLNICQFEYWISSKLANSPLFSILNDACNCLSSVTQAANFLVTASNFSSNFDANDLRDFFTELTSNQIALLLQNFQPDINNNREKEKFERDRAALLKQFK